MNAKALHRTGRLWSNPIKFNPDELIGQISDEDLTDSTTKINNVLVSLDEMSIDYNSGIENNKSLTVIKKGQIELKEEQNK
ncbi:Imm3 family immunity protein [Paenibacillus sp. NPDC058071]|uniref:Imm3 family immunity protein n=1 Tax=Paenibacillus sp. NPDC058071 TaxID=3346326 RepID=UPI0036DACDA0